MVISVRSGAHPRHHCPVRVAAPRPWPEWLQSGGTIAAVQPDGDQVVFMADAPAGSTATYRPAEDGPGGGMLLHDTGSAVEVTEAGHLVTRYVYADVPARPYFWPVMAPGGIAVTRDWPMSDTTPGETQDHKHHRSLYYAYGSVNGVDNWSEEEGHGHTVHRSIDELVQGPVFARLATTADWTDAAGKPLLVERARVTFWTGTEALRLVDFEIDLEAAYGDVRFGDTKEGGILSVRVASALDVPRGGRIENSFGGIDEGENWGRSAHWCDYSGVIDGRRVGICIMDHTASFRHPSYWHVRNYGLMTANPFALSDYTGGRKNGDHLLKGGECLAFRYRLALHAGDASESAMRGRYLDYVAPPIVEVAE